MVKNGQLQSKTVNNGQKWSIRVKHGKLGGDPSNSEHLPIFRAPREGDGRMHQSTAEGRMHQSMDAKKLHGEGTDTFVDKQTDGHCDY